MRKSFQKTMMALALVAFAGIVLEVHASEAASSIVIPYPPGMPAEQKPLVDRALDVLLANCPGLVHWRADLRLANVEVLDHYGNERDYGWPATIRVEFVVASPSQQIPDVRFSGHHLFYDLGGGSTPGISAAKRVAQDLCDDYMSRARRPVWTNYIKPVPALRFLDALAPPTE